MVIIHRSSFTYPFKQLSGWMFTSSNNFSAKGSMQEPRLFLGAVNANVTQIEEVNIGSFSSHIKKILYTTIECQYVYS